jgi:hypothetical protein
MQDKEKGGENKRKLKKRVETTWSLFGVLVAVQEGYVVLRTVGVASG